MQVPTPFTSAGISVAQLPSGCLYAWNQAVCEVPSETL